MAEFTIPIPATTIDSAKAAEWLKGLALAYDFAETGFTCTSGGGLNLSIAAGVAYGGGYRMKRDNVKTLALTTGSVRHIWVHPDLANIDTLVFTENAGASPNANAVKLAEVDTASGSIGTITDKRAREMNLYHDGVNTRYDSVLGSHVFNAIVRPMNNAVTDLGETTAQWRDLRLSGTIYLSGDTNLYRSAAGVLKTDTGMMILGSVSIGTGAFAGKLFVEDTGNTFAASFRGSAGTNKVSLGTVTGITNGTPAISGHTNASGAIELALNPSGGNVGIGLTTGIDAKLTFAASTLAAGGILFGADTNLYRSAADTLRTDDAFAAATFALPNSGIITRAGATGQTWTLPDATGTVALLGLAQTWSAVQTFSTPVTISNSGGMLLLKHTTGAATAMSSYVSFQDGANVERGWAGFGTGDTVLRIQNNIGVLRLEATGGVTIGTNTVAVLSAAQSWSAVQTFSAQPSFTNAGAPFLVSNATVVTNLNADTVDGQHAAAFALASHAHAWADVSKTGSSLADLATRSAGDLASGTLADARLSANVPLLAAANTFTGVITSNVGGEAVSLKPGATADHVYVGFYPDSQNPTIRGGFIGIPSAGLFEIRLVQERANTPLALLSDRHAMRDLTNADLLTVTAAGNGETWLSVVRNVAGLHTLSRVSYGAVDSAGVGFRELRIPN